MKQIAIRQLLSYFYTDSQEIESCGFDDKWESFDRELRTLMHTYGLEFAGTETFFLGLEKYSIAVCEQCGQLMVNRDSNPAGFSGNELAQGLESVISDGGECNGQLLCGACLPCSHRWGHSS